MNQEIRQEVIKSAVYKVVSGRTDRIVKTAYYSGKLPELSKEAQATWAKLRDKAASRAAMRGEIRKQAFAFIDQVKDIPQENLEKIASITKEASASPKQRQEAFEFCNKYAECADIARHAINQAQVHEKVAGVIRKGLNRLRTQA